MTKRSITPRQNACLSLALILAGLIGLAATGHYDPLPERAPDTGGVFVYYGPEGETVALEKVSPQDLALAEAALAQSDYFGAFAVGSGGRTGIWTGAWTAALAHTYAKTACGEGCVVVAERLPLHRDPTRNERVATTAMAHNLAVKGPFTNDFISTGGASAWGHRTKPGGSTGRKRAMRDAAAECETRRAQENGPDPTLSPPCTIARLTEIEDLRPKPELYPATFDIALTELVPVPVDDTDITKMPDAPGAGIFGAYLPRRLFGARAANGAASAEGVHQAGWPEAGATIALAKCNAKRRPGEGPCVLSHQRTPTTAIADNALAVPPTLYSDFLDWQKMEGVGAFAIGPYGAWGSSRGFDDLDAAIQKAADWCWYYTRKGWSYRQVDRAFLDPGVRCRIVAIRAPGT
ncbi:MAG: hypothetical protein AB8B60_19275 [Sulfitobacter sp.]